MSRSPSSRTPSSHSGVPPAAPVAALSAATASAKAPDTTGFRSSGQSPGIKKTLHLIGPGQVGRAFLQQVQHLPVRVVAVSDSTATVFDRDGLDVDAIVAHKAAGRSLATLGRAETIPTETALSVVAANLVVDATPTTGPGTAAAIQRATVALRSGAFLALCGKNALAARAAEWLLGASRGRVGIQAVLGGAGRQLVRELDELRQHCRGLVLCGNVTTTVIVQAIERGASIDEGIAQARALGLLEPDPTLDLDGSDAATKLAVVWGAVFGESWLPAVPAGAVPKQDLRTLDPRLLRARAARGATTRLVARGSRAGNDLRCAYEEVALGSPFAAPPDRVVYGYELPAGLRVHTGTAVGYAKTAGALIEDVEQALRAGEVSR